MQTSSNIGKRYTTGLSAVTVLASAAALLAWLWRVASDAGHAGVGEAPVRPDEALTAIVASAALVGVAWLALGLLLELLALGPGALGRLARLGADLVTPRLARRVVGALLGVGVAAGLAPGASLAAPATVVRARTPLPDPGFAPLPDPEWAPPAHEPADPARGWVPGAPVVRAHPDVRVLSSAPRRGSPRDAPVEVVVRRGDSLWSIAARHLGHDPSDAEIARAWPAWFEANRGAVGDDPDVLRPGQVLRAPEGLRS